MNGSPHLPIRAIMAFSVILAVTLWPAAPTRAATFAVNNNGDAGDAAPGDGVCRTSAAGNVCTLRAAIQEANARSGADTITIPAMTIVLGSYLRVTEGVTIVGGGQGSTFIDGNNAVRGFYFAPRSGSHSLSNLTLRRGRVTVQSDPVTEPLRQGNGGAILNEASLTLTNVTITNNQAVIGGGIYNMYDFIGGDGSLIVPTLVLNSVTISNNTATGTTFGGGGGGLFNGAALTAQNITISGNSALQGGGILNNNPHNRGVVYQVAVDNFVISGNTAKDAGGISNDLGDMTLTICTIPGNFANCCRPNGSYTGGGGIYNNDGVMTLRDVTVSNNQATSAGGYGGGLYNWKSMIMTNVTVSGNRAAYGAGIQNGNFDGQPNSLAMTNVTVSGNIGTSSTFYSYAGGILNTGNGQLSLTNTTVAQNSATFAGGIDTLLNRTTATVTLRNSILAGNTGSQGNPDCRGTIGTSGHNLIGNTSGCTFTPSGGDLVNVNPLLGPLQDNGGPTLTQALLAGSPAIDHGTNTGCPSTDQRGVARPLNGGIGPICDMGSFEMRVGAQANSRVFFPLVMR